MPMPRPFLTARWENLVLLNYACPPAILEPLVPRGTMLDSWNGETLVSLVGFLFRNTRVLGLRIPGHQTFEEVNLRFYVSRLAGEGGTRRAVVFVRELVPRRAIATVARKVYNEPYLAVPMSHRTSLTAAAGGSAIYSWRYGRGRFELAAEVAGPSRRPAAGSEAEFITEHYWGYTRQRDGETLEYQVEHPPWQVWDAPRAAFSGPARDLYGSVFGNLVSQQPRSAFVALGSEVTVHQGRRLPLAG
jgi:uncharacterized protein YqjF (DUF2071 family)